MPRRYILLDRDGTINVDAHYLSDPDGVALLPGAAEGLRRMMAIGFGLVVLTNQSGIGRGYFDAARLAQVHARLIEVLRGQGVELAGIYVCPHGPRDDCACRKPLTGLVEQAVAELGLDPAMGFMIGDKAADVDLGCAVGARTILVRTGYGAEVERLAKARPDWVVDDLIGAASIIEQACAAT